MCRTKVRCFGSDSFHDLKAVAIDELDRLVIATSFNSWMRMKN